MAPIHIPILAILLPFVIAIGQTVNPGLSAKLKLATTSTDRHAALPNNSDWTFNFTNEKHWTWTPGSVVNANAASFPALTGVGMTIAMLNLGPCAMLPPHSHPRATNVVVGITGNTTSYMVNENGVRTVEVNLTPMIMTIFPPGSLHAMQNNGCDNAQLVSALNSEDSGTLNHINGLTQLPLDIVNAGFGNANADFQIWGKRVPPVGTGSVMGSAECMKRCGIKAAAT